MSTDTSFEDRLRGIPGVGPARIRTLAARFPTLADLAFATLDEVASLKGMTRQVAADVLRDLADVRLTVKHGQGTAATAAAQPTKVRPAVAPTPETLAAPAPAPTTPAPTPAAAPAGPTPQRTLPARSRAQSAVDVLTGPQAVGFVSLLAAIVAWAAIDWRSAATGVFFGSTVLFTTSFGYKAWLATVGWRSRGDDVGTPARQLTDDELPRYTVLVPAYKEDNVIGQIIEHLATMDYPADRYEVLVLLEEGDHATIGAAQAAVVGKPNQHVLVVPDGHPRTKPRACNVGLEHATGDLLVIYDAEDRPEVDQLRKAASLFAQHAADGRDDIICLQARLDYHNHDENVLTRWFANEYNHWFDLAMPTLARRTLPVPLGGTSNHFRVDALAALGGWDAYNVTEDADLGVRLYEAGHATSTVDSITWEEASSTMRQWVPQRTRWLKGHMQTTLVHLRDLGWVRSRSKPVSAVATFAVLLGGGSASLLLSPLFWAMLAYHAVFGWDLLTELYPAPLLYAGVVNLVAGNLLYVYTNLLSARTRSRWHLGTAALTSPIYGLLMSWAAWRAVLQLATGRQHMWEKTPHGISQAGTDPAAG